MKKKICISIDEKLVEKAIPPRVFASIHRGIKLMFVLFQEIEQIIIKITLLILLIRYCLIIILQS